MINAAKNPIHVEVQTPNAEINISSTDLGAGIMAISFGSLAIQYFAASYIIHPLVAVIGCLFGSTFVLMGKISKKSKSD